MLDVTDNSLQASQDLLSQFAKEVKELEGTLAGGTKLGLAAQDLKSLVETRIRLGAPTDKLIRLTPKLFETAGVTLNEIYKRQMHDTFDFYYMTMPVNLYSAPGVQFQDLICELDFGPKGPGEPIIQAVFPQSEWHEVLSYGAGLNLGLNADLQWGVKLDLTDPELKALAQKLPGSVAANVQNANSYHGWLTVSPFSFTMGRKEITAPGKGDSLCRWTITKPALHQQDTVEFGLVFKVSQGQTAIELTAKTQARPFLPWLAADLRHVWAGLAAKFKDIVEGKTKVAIGDGEEWKPLALPA